MFGECLIGEVDDDDGLHYTSGYKCLFKSYFVFVFVFVVFV